MLARPDYRTMTYYRPTVLKYFWLKAMFPASAGQHNSAQHSKTKQQTGTYILWHYSLALPAKVSYSHLFTLNISLSVCFLFHILSLLCHN